MKKTGLIYICLALSLFISSCVSNDKINNSDNNRGISESSETEELNVSEISDNEVISSSLPVTEDVKNLSSKGQYDFRTEVLDADDSLECGYYTMPDKIDGYSYAVSGAYDKSNLLITVLYGGVDTGNSCSIGLYNCENSCFEKFIDINASCFVIYNDDRYVLLNNLDENCLMIYDISTDMCRKILYLTPNMSLMSFRPVRYDNNFYINICEYAEEREVVTPYIYQFDSDRFESSLYMSNCEKLFMINGEKYVVTNSPDDDRFNLVCSENNLNDSILKIPNNTSDLFCIDGCFYCETGGYNSKIVDMTNDRILISTLNDSGDSLTNIAASDYFLSWYDLTGEKNIPCIYDIKNSRAIQFNRFGNKYYRTLLNNNCGVIFELDRDGDFEICIFTCKE